MVVEVVVGVMVTLSTGESKVVKNSSNFGIGNADGSGELNNLLEANNNSCGREEVGELFRLVLSCWDGIFLLLLIFWQQKQMGLRTNEWRQGKIQVKKQ